MRSHGIVELGEEATVEKVGRKGESENRQTVQPKLEDSVVFRVGAHGGDDRTGLRMIEGVGAMWRNDPEEPWGR